MTLAFFLLLIVFCSSAIHALRRPKHVPAPDEESKRARRKGNEVDPTGGDITDAVIVDHTLRGGGESKVTSYPAVEGATAAAIAAAVLGD